jgi:hypothetical protein
MGDPKQPWFDGTAIVEFVELPIGLEQGLLHNVFTVHDRPGHASAIAMQARAKRRDGFEKRKITCFNWAFHVLRSVRIVHHASARLDLRLPKQAAKR